MLLLLVMVSAITCQGIATQKAPTLLLDGRPAVGTTPEAFDDDATPYDSEAFLPDHQKWADLLTLANMPKSMFDGDDTLSFKMTVTGASTTRMAPGYVGAALTPKDPDFVRPIVTYHVSMVQAPDQSLDPLHQYSLVSLESAPDGQRLFEIRYGNDRSTDAGAGVQDGATHLRVLSTVADADGGPARPQVLFDTILDFTFDLYHNFAITIDYGAATIAVYHSYGDMALTKVVAARPCVVTRPNFLRIGIDKAPLDTAPAQGKPISEAVIYGGIFVEDSSKGVVTSKLWYGNDDQLSSLS